MKQKLLIVLLGGLAMLGAFSTDTYLPSFPSMAKDFGVSLAAIQQSLTIFLIAMSGMTLFHGTLSDTFGRRPVILVCLVIYTFASFAAGFAPDLLTLLICRFLQGISAGAGMVVGRAMIRDRFVGPDAQKVMAYTTVVFGLAPVVAPILGGWLEVHRGWHSVFLFMAGFGALLLISCGWKLPESLPPVDRAPLHLGAVLGDYRRVMSNPRFMLQCASLALASSTLYLYISAAPVFVLDILHLPETAFAWLFIPMISGIMLGAVVSGRVAHKWSQPRILKIGLGLLIVTGSLNLLYAIFLPATVPGAIIPLMLCTFSMAFVTPTMALITIDLYPDRRGLASSLQVACNMAGFALLSGVVAPLLFQSAPKLAAGGFIGSLGCVALWIYSQRKGYSSTDLRTA